jgi:hypothetical protein
MLVTTNFAAKDLHAPDGTTITGWQLKIYLLDCDTLSLHPSCPQYIYT